MEGIGTVHAAGPAAAGQGAAVCIAIRPERMRLGGIGTTAASPGGAGVNVAHGTVSDVAYRGDVVEASIRLDGGMAVTVLHPLSDGTASGLPQPGAATTVTWAPAACMILPA